MSLVARNLTIKGQSLNCYDKLFDAFKFVLPDDSVQGLTMSQNQYAQRLGISSKTLRHYIYGLWQYVTSSIITLRDNGGRPRLLDSEGVSQALETIKRMVDGQNKPSKAVVSRIIGLAVSATGRSCENVQ